MFKFHCINLIKLDQVRGSLPSAEQVVEQVSESHFL